MRCFYPLIRRAVIEGVIYKERIRLGSDTALAHSQAFSADQQILAVFSAVGWWGWRGAPSPPHRVPSHGRRFKTSARANFSAQMTCLYA